MKCEQQHEERMLSMFSSIMNRMVQVTQQYPSPYCSYPVHPYSMYPTDMNYSTGDGPMYPYNNDPPSDTEVDQ